MSKKPRCVLSIVLLLCGVILLAWAGVPNRYQAIEVSILPEEMGLAVDEQNAEAAILEAYQVRLDWPKSMRIGDKEQIRVSFTPTQEGGGYPAPSVDLSDAYEGYNLMAEGRFEVAGLSVVPANPVRESLPRGQTVEYRWQINAKEAGSYHGTVWLWLRFLALDGSPARQVPIFVRQVDIQARSLGGISGPIARLLGGLAIILSMAVSFDVMIAWIRKKISQRTPKIRRINQ